MDTPGVWGLSGEGRAVELVSKELVMNCESQSEPIFIYFAFLSDYLNIARVICIIYLGGSERDVTS